MKRTLLALCLFVSSCTDPLTQVVVVVQTDLVPGEDFATVEVEVLGGTVVPDARFGPDVVRAFTRTFGDASATLPFSFGVLPEADVVTVTVRARDAFGREVVEQTRRGVVRPGPRLLSLALGLDCVSVGFECTELRGETCVAGACVAATPMELARVAPGEELEGIPAPPTEEARIVQRSHTLLEELRSVALAQGGTFALGDATLPHASPVNASVSVSPFRIDTHEVTIGRFRTFLTVMDRGMRGRVRYPDGTVRTFAAPSLPGGDRLGCARITEALVAAPYEAADSLPVTCVDWHTAQAFCVFEGGRLPTSAEWEHAAHGRGGVAGSAIYPWGDAPPMMAPTDACTTAWYTGCGGGLWPEAVGLLQSGAQSGAPGPAIYDLAGNAAEWTADRYESYAEAGCFPHVPLLDPSCELEGLDAEGARLDGFAILRGGAIAPVDGSDDGVTGLRAGAFMPLRTETRSPYVGFRCVYDGTP